MMLALCASRSARPHRFCQSAAAASTSEKGNYRAIPQLGLKRQTVRRNAQNQRVVVKLRRALGFQEVSHGILFLSGIREQTHFRCVEIITCSNHLIDLNLKRLSPLCTSC